MRKNKGRRYSGIGGQAVLEGVMMKNKEQYAIAVRKPDGEIDVEVGVYRGIMHGSKLKEIPFVRGIFNFLDSMNLGMRTLNHSVSFYEDEGAKETVADKVFNKIFKEKAENVMLGIVTLLSIALAIAIFMVLPYFISSQFEDYIRNRSVLAVIEGLIRILVFVGYIVAITMMKDIKRLYQYHGAEHKCIDCIERGRPLTVRNVMRSSRQHKRCGTSFMFFVIFVSIIVFFFIRVEQPALKIALRVALIPVIAGISYEIIRLAGRSNNIFVWILSAPGMWLQRLTTKEPDESMVEVAMAAVEAVFDWKLYLKEAFGYEVDDSWLDDGAPEDMEEEEGGSEEGAAGEAEKEGDSNAEAAGEGRKEDGSMEETAGEGRKEDGSMEEAAGEGRKEDGSMEEAAGEGRKEDGSEEEDAGEDIDEGGSHGV